MSEFEKTYAQNIAPVFQAISQDLQLPEKKLLGQNVLLEICRDFGQAVVLMSDYLQVNEILAKIEAAKKIKPKKGTKVPLIQLPKKSPDVLQAELRAMSAKIDGSILALQRDWEEQIQNKEIKE
jgi:AICAR transformylase/IMP cyclohydrolase PurH